MIGAMGTWTTKLDKILTETLREGGTYAEAARRIGRASRGSFEPHPSTCLRRARALRAELSTRVDTSRIPPRRRAPIGERLRPPNVMIVALPLAFVDADLRGDVDGTLRDVLCALPPGWSWSALDPDAVRLDVLASARHQATLRGDVLEVLEDAPGSWPVVFFRRAHALRGRQLVLVAVAIVPRS